MTKPEALPIVARLTHDDGLTWQNLTDHATATAQLAALQAEVERYRELRRGQHWSVINGIGDELKGEDLDAAIDAALLARKGE